MSGAPGPDGRGVELSSRRAYKIDVLEIFLWTFYVKWRSHIDMYRSCRLVLLII